MSTRARDLNADLIGRPGSRWDIATPALVLDLDAMERNIAAMADHCMKAGLSLRPHTKTHKSVEIAVRQMEAGAVGVCCAKLAEAETMAAGGIGPILLTSPVVSPRAIDRIVTLNASSNGLAVVVDNPEVLRAISSRVGESGERLTVLVDLDVGLHRTGIAPGDGAVALAGQIVNDPHLDFGGLQAYAGHLMHVEGLADRRDRSLAAMEKLGAMRDALNAQGIETPVLTGGGTGTFDIDPAAGVLTDLQGGSYVFMDKEYNDVEGAADGHIPFETALYVQATVISANTPGIATTDAGLKSFATDGPKPEIAAGAPAGAAYAYFGDEQGIVIFADKRDYLAPGAVVSCVTSHCDPTVNLYDAYHCVRGDTLVDIWPVDARGASQ